MYRKNADVRFQWVVYYLYEKFFVERTQSSHPVLCYPLASTSQAMRDGLVFPPGADSTRCEITISITRIPERGARDHRMKAWM